MGSGSSKDVAAAASSSGGVAKPRSRRVRVFKSSCFGLLSVLSDGHQVGDLSLFPFVLRVFFSTFLGLHLNERS